MEAWGKSDAPGLFSSFFYAFLPYKRDQFSYNIWEAVLGTGQLAPCWQIAPQAETKMDVVRLSPERMGWALKLLLKDKTPRLGSRFWKRWPNQILRVEYHVIELAKKPKPTKDLRGNIMPEKCQVWYTGSTSISSNPKPPPASVFKWNILNQYLFVQSTNI